MNTRAKNNGAYDHAALSRGGRTLSSMQRGAGMEVVVVSKEVEERRRRVTNDAKLKMARITLQWNPKLSDEQIAMSAQVSLADVKRLRKEVS